MKDLIDLLPIIILYIASGFIFLQVFNFVAAIRPSGSFEHLFIKSLITGFVICTIGNIIPIRTANQYVDIAILLAICVLAGLLFGKVYISPCFDKGLENLGIRRTVNPYIWKDIVDIKNGVWVYVEYRSEDRAYLGALNSYEEFERHPQIVLERYDERVLSTSEKDTSHVNDPTRCILLDTSKADIVEIFYTDNSPKIERIKEAIENQKHGSQ